MATQDQLREILGAALDVASSAPKKRARDSYSATVRWTDIERLRAALEAAGYGWRELNDRKHSHFASYQGGRK